MQYYTYIYLDPSREDEPFYVGKGKGVRKDRHLTRKDHAPFPNRLRKMAKNKVVPHIMVLAALDEYHALFQEIALIASIGRKDLGLGPLLNLTDGGDGSSGVTSETAARLATAARNRVWTDESRLKLSKAHIGKIVTAATKARMSIASSKRGKRCTVDGIIVYPSRHALRNELGQGVQGLNNPGFCYVRS